MFKAWTHFNRDQVHAMKQGVSKPKRVIASERVPNPDAPGQGDVSRYFDGPVCADESRRRKTHAVAMVTGHVSSGGSGQLSLQAGFIRFERRNTSRNCRTDNLRHRGRGNDLLGHGLTNAISSLGTPAALKG
ncbi:MULTISPECIES: hypothetical protein [unclassified Pseudomonas]|uniref:hypothetical protein n=1 Tax=unclassified Pseudomonas TaxID=196821 RepID=UPI002B235F9F|nr:MULTISPECIES: hypothetical protein [unclassified Pseudomonas]MEA9994318.1 hypothetical protein [Pseudomonas sp. AA4]MEB0126572.1 hypothetical protein [Pseudomonas sp. CCC1.2]MEB0154014.1 hypothetical protein [Pseudomonas sp. CCC4.3]MEB0220782.1 hypothetical protein [Pseudomonas sp. AB12(2023)]